MDVNETRSQALRKLVDLYMFWSKDCFSHLLYSAIISTPNSQTNVEQVCIRSTGLRNSHVNMQSENIVRIQ